MNLQIAQQEDFNIPAPRQYKSGDEIKPGETNLSDSTLIVIDPPAFGLMQGLIAASVLLVLTIVFFFIKRGLENHLIANQASPRRAEQAGWVFFLMLFAITVTLVLVFISPEPLWEFMPILFWSLVAVDIVTVIVFSVVVSGARRSARIT